MRRKDSRCLEAGSVADRFARAIDITTIQCLPSRSRVLPSFEDQPKACSWKSRRRASTAGAIQHGEVLAQGSGLALVAVKSTIERDRQRGYSLIKRFLNVGLPLMAYREERPENRQFIGSIRGACKNEHVPWSATKNSFLSQRPVLWQQPHRTRTAVPGGVGSIWIESSIRFLLPFNELDTIIVSSSLSITHFFVFFTQPFWLSFFRTQSLLRISWDIYLTFFLALAFLSSNHCNWLVLPPCLFSPYYHVLQWINIKPLVVSILRIYIKLIDFKIQILLIMTLIFSMQ